MSTDGAGGWDGRDPPRLEGIRDKVSFETTNRLTYYEFRYPSAEPRLASRLRMSRNDKRSPIDLRHTSEVGETDAKFSMCASPIPVSVS